MMSDPTPTQPQTGPRGWTDTREDRLDRLTAYFAEHDARYTFEALRAASESAGFSAEEIAEASTRAATRRERGRAAQPLRTRARWIVLAAYTLVYAVLAVVLLQAPNLDAYGAGEISLIVLTILLGIALLISIAWVNRRGRAPDRLEGAMVAMLVLPTILLFGVAGLCVATTRPLLVN